MMVFRLQYLADTFFKMNIVNLSLQEKQLTIFVATDKILKTCIYHHELDRFPTLKYFFDPMDGEFNKCDLFYIDIL